MALSRRTQLGLSPEVQSILRIIVSFDQTNFYTARALVATGFDYEGAARMLFLSHSCSGHGCRRCARQDDLVARAKRMLRQRVKRMTDRVRGLLGPSWHVPVRRRGEVRFGADAMMEFQADPGSPDPLEELVAKEEVGK